MYKKTKILTSQILKFAVETFFSKKNLFKLIKIISLIKIKRKLSEYYKYMFQIFFYK